MPLTAEQAALLAAELAKPTYAGKTDAECSVLLNTPAAIAGSTTRRRVPIGEVQTKAFELGLIYPLVQASKVAETASLAETVMEFFQGPHLEDVDMDKPKFREMLAGLKLIGILNNTTEAAILALADAAIPGSLGLTPFQAIPGLGDVPLPMLDGTANQGTCHTWMVTQARSN